ncbi:MAG: cyclic nucleotide-binding domain-containing protein, partial [Polyangiales bacterium]
MPDDHARLHRELFLRSFFGGANSSPLMLDRLSALVDERDVPAGHVLFREGDAAERLYFVTGGGVRMSREGHRSYLYAGRWLIGAIDLLNR